MDCDCLFNRFIVEQQFAKAVVIVLRTRAYVDTISKDRNQQPQVKQNAVSQQNRSNVGSSVANTSVEAETAAAQTAALLRVLDMVDGLCAHLAITIKKSILNLPNSSVRCENISPSPCCVYVCVLINVCHLFFC